MKNALLGLFLFFILICISGVFSKPVLAINRIEGQVFDPNRVPINDVRIELLNDVESILGSTKTSSGGRFTFAGVSRGRFIIKAIPLATNFLTETKEVEIVSSVGFGSDTAYVEIYLRYDRQNDEVSENKPAEAIFVQDIPKDAKKLYETGVESLKKKQDNGLSELEEAIKIYPDYFDALSSLGREYNNRKDYKKAYPYLLRAIDINPRNISAFYSLAYAFSQLDEIPAALKAAQATTILAPEYIDAQLLYGILLRINKDYKNAETVLLKAKSLSKNNNAEVCWQLALLYNKLNKNKEAANELETYLKLKPNSQDKKKTEELIIKLRNSK